MLEMIQSECLSVNQYSLCIKQAHDSYFNTWIQPTPWIQIGISYSIVIMDGGY